MNKPAMRNVIKIIQLCFVVGLILWSLQSALKFVRDAGHLWNPDALNQDAASTWESRLRGVKDDLPAEGMVGYLSEQDYPGAVFSATDQDEEFALTQYALAPLILDRGNSAHDLVVGNFAGETDYQFEDVLGLRLIHNYGYGIYLFEGIAP